MNCSLSQAVLDSLIEAELDQQTAAEVRAHVASCANCARCYEALLSEREIFHQYVNEVDPAFDLWARVDHAIADIEPKRNRWFKQFLPGSLRSLPARAAFASIIALLLIWVLVNTLRRTNAPQHETDRLVFHGQAPTSVSVDRVTASAKHPSPKESKVGISKTSNKPSKIRIATLTQTGINAEPDLRASTTGAIRHAERRYSAAIALLTREYANYRQQLEPSALRQFEETLASLDATIDDTRRVAYAEPNNPVAVQYLMTAYAAKLDALRHRISV